MGIPRGTAPRRARSGRAVPRGKGGKNELEGKTKGESSIFKAGQVGSIRHGGRGSQPKGTKVGHTASGASWGIEGGTGRDKGRNRDAPSRAEDEMTPNRGPGVPFSCASFLRTMSWGHAIHSD